MRSRLLPSLLLCAAACSGSSLPPPTVVSIGPAERPASSSGPLTVTIDAVLPTTVDYAAGTAAVDDRLTLKIGSTPFGPSRWTDGGVVTAFLGSVLVDDLYDVTVELGDGRRATVPGAFRVTTGDWPSSYAIDPIPAETEGVPFGVTIRAHGTTDGGYGGTVYLQVVPNARVTPQISGAFVDGVRVETISVDVDDRGMHQLLVYDLVNNVGVSLPFDVR